VVGVGLPHLAVVSSAQVDGLEGDHLGLVEVALPVDALVGHALEKVGQVVVPGVVPGDQVVDPTGAGAGVEERAVRERAGGDVGVPVGEHRVLRRKFVEHRCGLRRERAADGLHLGGREFAPGLPQRVVEEVQGKTVHRCHLAGTGGIEGRLHHVRERQVGRLARVRLRHVAAVHLRIDVGVALAGVRDRIGEVGRGPHRHRAAGIRELDRAADQALAFVDVRQMPQQVVEGAVLEHDDNPVLDLLDRHLQLLIGRSARPV